MITLFNYSTWYARIVHWVLMWSIESISILNCSHIKWHHLKYSISVHTFILKVFWSEKLLLSLHRHNSVWEKKHVYCLRKNSFCCPCWEKWVVWCRYDIRARVIKYLKIRCNKCERNSFWNMRNLPFQIISVRLVSEIFQFYALACVTPCACLCDSMRLYVRVWYVRIFPTFKGDANRYSHQDTSLISFN